MTQDQTCTRDALETMLASLERELDALIDLTVMPASPSRFGDVLTRCINALALAKASRTLNAREA